MITRLGRSIRARLALFASIAMALLCLITSSLLLWSAQGALVDIRTNEVIGSALRVVHLIKEHDGPPPVIEMNGHSVQAVDQSGRVVSATPDLRSAPRLTNLTPSPGTVSRIGPVCDVPQFHGECQIMVAFRVYDDDGHWIVYAFGPVPPWYVNPSALVLLAGASAALVVLAWFGASRMVAKTLAPVDNITHRLAEITAGNGRMRVPVPENADEIRALAETANQTLARLEQAVEQQRRFASDASHDLRSPLTAMRAELEEALLAADETDWRATGARLLTSLDRLQNIVTDLLMLTRLDAGAPGHLEPVNLAELVKSEAQRTRCKKKIVTSLEPGVIVIGDRLRLARLLTNLLDNAERHAESTIIVSVRQIRGEAVLEVEDDGAGIAPEHREVVFQRFTRLDASRNRDAGGTGLGLPIAREIAHAHGGTLRIEDCDKGARFVLRIPKNDS
ncbi:sensor histidine kinase [Nonomuraea aridisoli]|uniref:histidine kinase n=1 Tax=Nonomuraea aridisoli TaxID=2070368 RepID=A0A2W2EM21_9ACTN|nr:HAMP domain-containing sensor histidine kinase [Nonomuraea aridisoli]PZG14630.1 sensor histidine kinase [Nonomuraea aridisoli]